MHLTVCFCHVTYAFQGESTLYICLNVKELLARNRRDIWSLSDCNGTRTHKHLVRKRTLSHFAKLTKWFRWVVSFYLYGAFDCMFFNITYAFHGESTLYICLNVKELLARNRRDSSSLSDCNGTRTRNHLVRKGTLNHLPKLTKWLRWVVSTYLYSAFDCMFLSCQVRLQTKWLWVRVPLPSLKLQIFRLFWARSSLTFRKI